MQTHIGTDLLRDGPISDPPDDEKTYLGGAITLRSPSASTNIAAPENQVLALRIGTRLAEFEITAVIGLGGFGIVYLAHDESLGRNVAIKEYMPSSLASRIDGLSVQPNSERSAETFFAGLRSFMNEARMLAMFDHASLVKVYRVWEANGTAYMVMPHYQGLTLKQTLQEMNEPPSQVWLLKLLEPLMDALELIHGKNCFHRDIAPDNILLLDGGRPVLIDFGAARLVIGDMVRNLTVILKPGYAPIEQYAGDPNMPQGAWTDVYALGAVAHYAITGKPPLVSVGRLVNDTAEPLERSGKGRYIEGFLRAIDRALAVRATDRPQDVAQFRAMLTADASAQTPLASSQPDKLVHSHSASRKPGLKIWLAGFGAVLVLSTSAFLITNRGTGSVAQVAAQKVQPVAPVPVIAVAVKPAEALPFDPMAPLNRLFEQRELDHVVSVGLDKTRLKIKKDKFRFRIQSARDGYVYILMLESNKQHLTLLFPNALDNGNKVRANKEISLPRKNWEMTAEGPAGSDHFIVIVSKHPRDFSQAGLKKTGQFSEFALDLVKSNSDTNTLAGSPVCAAAGDCSAAYGAASFSIEEVK